MRIIVVPILRGNWAFFCHSTHPPTGRIAKWVAWSSAKWEKLGNEPPDTIKKRLHVYGTKIIDRADHEEQFLKAVPTMEDVADKQLQVPVHYPSALRPDDVSRHFRRHIEERQAHHKRYLFYSLLWLPLTGAFSIVPLVPNIPFFYNAFRLYSHYKAFKGAQHLLHLSTENKVRFKAETFLNCAVKFRESSLSSRSEEDPSAGLSDEELESDRERSALRRQALDDSCLLHIARAFRESVPTLGPELEQARAQIIQRERESVAAGRRGRWRKAPHNVVTHDTEASEEGGEVLRKREVARGA